MRRKTESKGTLSYNGTVDKRTVRWERAVDWDRTADHLVQDISRFVLPYS